MTKYTKRISCTRGIGSREDLVSLHWQFDGVTWEAEETIPGVNNYQRLPNLDTKSTEEVIKMVTLFYDDSLDF